ncbi:MAG: signal peptidase II [Aliidongia sp.]
MTVKPMLLRGVVAALIVLILDQASKLAILRLFEDQSAARYPVLPIFDLRLTFNHGITFGLFNNSSAANALIFSGLALAIVAALVVALTRVTAWHNALALGVIIGGALGNLIDRLRLDAVVDFLDFHLGNWHFYIFNLGDSAICLGVGLLLLDSLLIRAESPK